MTTPRPSERVADEDIRRAQKTQNIGKGLIGAAAASRIVPFLSEHIPLDLAVKGISKISPKLGSFLQSGMDKGLDAKSGLSFIKDNFNKTKSAPDQRSIIQQYSPELNEFLQKEIQNGRSPLEAGALAEFSGKYKKAINKMVEDHKTPFSSILESVFGAVSSLNKDKNSLSKVLSNRKDPVITMRP